MIKLIDWSFFSEKEKYDFIDNHSPEEIINYIDSMHRNKLSAFDRLDKAHNEITLLREQIRKLPYIFKAKS